MILKILQTGHEVLRKKAKELSLDEIQAPATQQLIDLMVDSLRDQMGVGLAAPQIGESKRIIIIEDKLEYQAKVPKQLLKAQNRVPVPLMVIINPVLHIETGTEKLYFEGCLSVDGYAAVTARADKVTVKGLNREGKPISLSAEGWLARILQHEVDHLNGVLYVDKMLPKTFITIKSYISTWMPANLKDLSEFISKNKL